MTAPKVTILVPHYKTLELTKLCLRLLRKHTDLNLAKIIVIDNDSRDESTVYLRSLKWLHLMERSPVPGESPVLSHSRALDLALEQVTTPYVLSIHTDTLVRNKHWLPFLLEKIETDSTIAGVGSWKLENKPLWKRIFKNIENVIQSQKSQQKYLRSHCALYRTELIKRYHSGFSAGDETAGKALHRELIQHGHKMIFLSSADLLKYMDHINHATTVLNPELSRHGKSVQRGLKRIQKSLESFNANAILADNRLDL